MKFNPAGVSALVQFSQEGLHMTRRGAAHYARLRSFDPIQCRAGLPEDVAALVKTLEDEKITLNLINAKGDGLRIALEAPVPDSTFAPTSQTPS